MRDGQIVIFVPFLLQLDSIVQHMISFFQIKSDPNCRHFAEFWINSLAVDDDFEGNKFAAESFWLSEDSSVEDIWKTRDVQRLPGKVGWLIDIA